MKRLGIFSILGLLLAIPAQAAVYDLRISPGDVMISPSTIIARQTVRIYATVENVGERDAEGTIEFYDGDRRIGSKALSVRAGGRPDEVWIPWTPESEGNHFLRVRLVSDPDTPDESQDNGLVTMDVFSDRDTDGDGFGDRADQDDDNDGALDTVDQFPQDPRRQKDADNDGVEDVQDTDDDNDGLLDVDETKLGTNPLNRDTDGDGVGDKEDVYPLDRSRFKREEPKPVVPPVPAPQPQTQPTNPSVRTSPIAPAARAPSVPPLLPTTTTSSVLSLPDSLIQPVTTSVLAQIGVSTSSLEGVARPSSSSAQEVVHEMQTVSTSEESSSPIIPILVGLAILSAAVGGWFLFKSRSV